MGEAEPGYKFLLENPGIFKDLLKFAACSALGQAFIFYMISSFDPLVCTTITTTRKVFSVLLSVFTKGHNLNGQGWAGIACACGGILGELEEKYSKGKEATKKKTDGDKKKDDSKKGDENKKNGANDENKKK